MKNTFDDLNKKIEESSKNGELYFERGELYLKQDNTNSAEKDFNKAIQLGCDNEIVYFSRGTIFEKEKFSLEKAIADFSKVIELNPGNIDAYYKRAKIYEMQSKDELALIDFDKIIQIEGVESNSKIIAKVYLKRGLIHYKQNRFENALDDFYKVRPMYQQYFKQKTDVQIDGSLFLLILDFADAFMHCCKIHLKMKNEKKFQIDFENAKKEYNYICKSLPTFDLGFLKRGLFYLEFGEFDLAEEDFNQTIEIEPDNVENCISIGDAYLKKDDIKSAELWYDRIFDRIQTEYGVWSEDDFDLVYNAFLDLAEVFKAEEKFNSAEASLDTVKSLCDIAVGSTMELDTWLVYKEEVESKIRRLQDIQYSKKLEAKNIELQKAKEELEDIMAMFAHKFRGPLQNIIWNVDHSNKVKVLQEAVRTMSGLLDIFSTVSTSSEHLQQKLIADKKGDSCVMEILKKSIVLAVSQGLSHRNIQKSRQHYIRFAKKERLVPENITRQHWNEEFYEIEANLQKDWETEFMDFLDLSDPVSMLDWIEQHFCKFEIEGFDADDTQFQKYGPKESIMIIIFVEMLLNALKYYDSDKKQPIKVLWKNKGEHYDFVVENPSSPKERDIDKGSGKGHHFLRKISIKLGHEMPELVFADTFIVSFPFDNKLLVQ
jgi:tetratricopeptide (TPR) repeat protein